jgi:hypothetical protein
MLSVIVDHAYGFLQGIVGAKEVGGDVGDSLLEC